jgi:hypothetical protein
MKMKAEGRAGIVAAEATELPAHANFSNLSSRAQRGICFSVQSGFTKILASMQNAHYDAPSGELPI